VGVELRVHAPTSATTAANGCWRPSCRVPVSFRFAARVTRQLACPYRALSGCQVSRPSTQGTGMPDREFSVDFFERVRAGLVDGWRNAERCAA
jgi:hypothetical protein